MSVGYRPTGETSVVIVPPPDVMGYADYYRSRYMADTRRFIEPHITVAAPFVHYNRLPQALPRLKQVIAQCGPRRISLRGFRIFPDEGILYLYMADPERVLSLYRAIFAEFPECPAYGGRFGDDWVPHLTVGHFTDRRQLEYVYNELSVQRLYIGFDVERVLVKARMDDGIWDTWAEVPLGEGLQEGE